MATDNAPNTGRGSLAQGPVTPKRDAERRLLAEMQMPISAERVIGASFAATSSEKAPEASPDALDDGRSSIAAGAFVGGRTLLTGAAEANAAVDELTQSLAGKGRSKEPGELIALWTAAESLLHAGELDELWPAVNARLTGQPDRLIRSRGAGAQGDGARSQREGY